MTTASNVATWFLTKDSMTHKKLQKLCYYAKAWGLALLGEEIFQEQPEAWVHGPVIAELYPKYAGYGWQEIEQVAVETAPAIDDEITDVLESVWATYKELSGDQLETLTHQESPWQNARGDANIWEASHAHISNSDMADFYRSLYEEEQND